VPDRDEREEAARLFVIAEAAREEYWKVQISSKDLTNDQRSEMEALSEEYRRRQDETRKWYDGEREKILVEDPRLGKLIMASEIACRAYDEAPGGAIVDNGDGDAARCAISGVPLYDDDVVLEINGKQLLASLLLPDDVIEHLAVDEEETDDDEEGEAEEAVA
jgi:hypothetical protein